MHSALFKIISRPSISVSYVQNFGEGTAKNVKVTINKGYEGPIKALNLDGYKMFMEGVAIYPPNYELHFFLNEWEDKDLITRRQMQIRWNMVEPIPASVMHYARMKEVI